MSKQCAFSLLETLLVLSLVAIMATLAVPAWQAWIVHAQDKSLQQLLIHALRFAEQQAHLIGIDIVICPKGEAHSCGVNWNNGVLTFNDIHGDNQLHERNQILAVTDFSQTHGQLHWRGYPHYRQYIHFSAAEWTGEDDGTFWFCHHKDNHAAWALTLNKAGNVHLLKRDKNNLIKDNRGRELVC